MRLIFAISGLVLCAAVAHSGTVPSVGTEVFTVLGCPATDPCTRVREDILSPGPQSISKTYSTPLTQMTINDSAASGYGVLRAQASTTFSSNGGYGVTDAFASFTDVITISFAPWNGSPGYLYLKYNLDGSSSATGKADAMANIAFSVDSNPGYFLDNIYSASGQYAVPMAFPFIYGQPFSLFVELGAYTGTAVGGPGSGTVNQYVVGNGTGTAAFSDTFILSGMALTDSAGNPVTGASFTSASGTQYGPDGVVPEPSSVGLLLCGGLALTAAKMALGRNL